MMVFLYKHLISQTHYGSFIQKPSFVKNVM